MHTLSGKTRYIIAVLISKNQKHDYNPFRIKIKRLHHLRLTHPPPLQETNWTVFFWINFQCYFFSSLIFKSIYFKSRKPRWSNCNVFNTFCWFIIANKEVQRRFSQSYIIYFDFLILLLDEIWFQTNTFTR